MKYSYSLNSGIKKIRTKTTAFVSAGVLSAGALGLGLAMPMAASAAPAPSYHTFGDASVVSDGNPGNAVQMGNNEGAGHGGVDFTGTGVTTLSDLNNLSTDCNFTEGQYGAGTPRFGASVESADGSDSGTIFFYVNNCPQNSWGNTGNLADQSNNVDASQLNGGSYSESYSQVQGDYGNYNVTDLFIVSDSSNNAAQTLLIDNTVVGSGNYDYGQPDTTAPVAQITNPTEGSTVSGMVDIRGTVTDQNPDHYFLKITNESGQKIYGNTVYTDQSFTDQTLYNWDTTQVPDGTYTIDLEARDQAGNKTSASVDQVTVTVNNTVDNKDQCKDGGWMSFTEPAFKNQGQCVAYVNHHDGNGADDANATVNEHGRH